MVGNSSPGRPRRTSDAEIIRAIADIAAAERVATTSEVEDRVALSRRGLQKRLRDLHERGEIKSKEVGARGRVWWLPHAANSINQSSVCDSAAGDSESIPADQQSTKSESATTSDRSAEAGDNGDEQEDR